MGCLFGIFKLAYVLLTIIILVDHFEYIYKYLEVFKWEDFFSNNNFAHAMGMFLGLLFRISGMLSAMKEKIALSTTYALFLLMLLVLMSGIDFIFYLYLVTATYAFTYVVVLKYMRAKARKQRARANRALAAQQRQSVASASAAETTSATQVALDLANGGTALHTHSTSPSAPPYEYVAGQQAAMAPGYPADNPHYRGAPPAPGGELYFSGQHNTPPPSYAELYETK